MTSNYKKSAEEEEADNIAKRVSPDASVLMLSEVPHVVLPIYEALRVAKLLDTHPNKPLRFKRGDRVGILKEKNDDSSMRGPAIVVRTGRAGDETPYYVSFDEPCVGETDPQWVSVDRVVSIDEYQK